MSEPHAEWDNHTEEAECLQTKLIVPGRGMGKIHPRFFEAETWARHLESAIETRRYAEFVDAMMNRIRFEESDPVEIRSFVKLIATDSNWKFMEVAVARIPELRKINLHDQKHFQLALLFQQLKQRVNKRSVQECPVPKQPEVWLYQRGLQPAEKEMIGGYMFGPNTAATGAVKSDSMRRLFPSAIANMFPQAALNNSIAKARDRGTDIERDHEGLPYHMLFPPGHCRRERLQGPPEDRICSNDHFFTSGGVRLSTGPVWPVRPTGASRENTSFTVHDSSEEDNNPPPGLLTQLDFDGVNDPRQTTPHKYRSSHGKLPEIRLSEEAKVFAVRRAESPNRPQVPDDAPPPFIKTETDQDVFRAIHGTAGPLVLLEYFNSLPALPLLIEPEQPERPVVASPVINGILEDKDNKSEEPVLLLREGNGSVPTEQVVKNPGGGFSRQMVVVSPFHRSNAIKHPKDSYVTGLRNGKLVIL